MVTFYPYHVSKEMTMLSGIEINDAELVYAARAGQVDAFLTLVRRYHGASLAAARQLTANIEDAEDMVQEAVVQAYRKLHLLQEADKFRGLFFAIVRRKCFNLRRCRHNEVLPLDTCTELPAIPDEETPNCAELLSRLPFAAREVLIARYFYDLSYEEMATIFDQTAHTMRMRCCRARTQLRMMMEDEETETRRMLYGVEASLTLGFPLDAFLTRLSHELVRIPLPPPVPPSAPPPLLPAGTALPTVTAVPAGIGALPLHLLIAKGAVGVLASCFWAR